MLFRSYLGKSDGYNVYIDTSIRFSMNLAPAIIMSFLATAVVAVASFIKYQNDKKKYIELQSIAEESM